MAVIVTGAASGIGLSVVSRLLQRGESVVAVDLSRDSLSKLSAQFSDPPRLATCCVDVTAPDGPAKAFAAAAPLGGGARVLGVTPQVLPL
jgi:NAD(P)-dependent dehydrogenase (short-subunit alcohol dehydrogenase family)